MIDWLLIVLRIAHVGGAMAWFGGAIVSAFFLFPAARAAGPTAQPLMEQLMKGRRLGIYFPIVAATTVLSGAALFWRDSGGLQPAWLGTPTGLAYTIGGLAAIAAFVGGMLLIGPSVAAQAAVQAELAASGGEPTAAQRARLALAERRMRLANQIDAPLILVAGLTMAIGRYL